MKSRALGHSWRGMTDAARRGTVERGGAGVLTVETKDLRDVFLSASGSFTIRLEINV